MTVMQPIKDLEVLSKHWKPDGLTGSEDRLYNMLVLEGMYREEAERIFISEGKSPSQFRNVHSTLMDKMIGGIIASDFKQYDPAKRIFYKTMRKYFGAEIFITSGSRDIGVAIAGNALQMAKKYHRIELCLAIARRLTKHYSSIAPNLGRRNFYREKVNYYQKELIAEIHIEDIFDEISFRLNLVQPIDDIIPQLEQVRERGHRRHDYLLYTSRVLAAFYMNDLRAVIDICDYSLDNLGRDSNMPSAETFTFVFYKLPVLIITKDFAKANRDIKECVSMYKAGTYNWHITIYLQIITAFHSNDIGTALSSYQIANRYSNRSGSEIVKQRLLIVKAYLALYAKLGRIEMDVDFKLYKFLNELGEASRDKKGLNVAVTIVHFLHLLLDMKLARESGKNYQVLRKKKAYMALAEKVKGYVGAQLNKPDDKRSATILHMFVAIEFADYGKALVLKKTSKKREELFGTKLSANINGLDPEPVPFETCWEIAIATLVP